MTNVKRSPTVGGVLFAPLVSGFLFSLSLIVVIGAQNAYLLQQGARREHVWTVVLICFVCDVALIAAGVAGMGAVVRIDPGVQTITRTVGAALLLAYGLFAARRALRPAPVEIAAHSSRGSRRRVVLATLAFTWLNPNVYLDTLILLGTVANAHPGTRWWFGAGAAAGSACWFVALGWAAQSLSGVLRRPLALRFTEGFVAISMVVGALRTLPF